MARSRFFSTSLAAGDATMASSSAPAPEAPAAPEASEAPRPATTDDTPATDPVLHEPSGLTVNGVRVPYRIEAEGADAITAYVAARKPASGDAATTTGSAPAPAAADPNAEA